MIEGRPMFTRTCFPTLAIVVTALAITAANGAALAYEPRGADLPALTTTGQADLDPRQSDECNLYRRAISRHGRTDMAPI